MSKTNNVIGMGTATTITCKEVLDYQDKLLTGVKIQNSDFEAAAVAHTAICESCRTAFLTKTKNREHH